LWLSLAERTEPAVALTITAIGGVFLMVWKPNLW